MRVKLLLQALVSAALLPAALVAQEEKPTNVGDLAKAAQNPVASLISIPFQFNFNSGGGLGAGTLFNLNVQPVIPISATKDWNVIFRTIIPFLSSPTPSGDQVSGIGDIQLQFFASPARPGKLIWGVGPIFSVPAATNPLFRTGSWAVGPTAVVLTTPGHWVLGILANQLWTFAQSGDATDVNQLLVQPFVNYNFGKGWALSSAGVITANWNGTGQQWTVPLGGGLSKTTVFNRRPMTIAGQYYYNVVRPESGPSSQFRLFISLLYPAGPKPGEKK